MASNRSMIAMICCSMTFTFVANKSTDDVRAEVSSPIDRVVCEALEPFELVDFSDGRIGGCD